VSALLVAAFEEIDDRGNAAAKLAIAATNAKYLRYVIRLWPWICVNPPATANVDDRTDEVRATVPFIDRSSRIGSVLETEKPVYYIF
jgi:hypothetical protein